MPPPGSPSAARHRVVALAFEGVNAFELAVACEVFGLHRPELEAEWYDFVVAGPAGTAIPFAGGSSLTPAAGLEAAASADTVVVPNASPRGGPTAPAGVVSALRDAHERGARVMSYCSGAFALADAGLLDGRPATTHWLYAERFAERFPRVELRDNVLYVDDGDVLTSAGSAAAIDLSLHVVRLDHGADIANAVARRMVVPPHRDGGQAQFVHQPVVDSCDPSDDLAPVLDWALANLTEPLTVETLAARALMSPRTFARRFQATVGTTPLQWVLRQRVHRAQELLETTELPLDRVAQECGLGTAANMRLHMRRVADTSPSAYRRAFRQQVRRPA